MANVLSKYMLPSTRPASFTPPQQKLQNIIRQANPINRPVKGVSSYIPPTPQPQPIGVQAPQPSAPTNTNNQPSYFETVPNQPPSFDETPFNDLISQIDQLGSTFKFSTDTAVAGVEKQQSAQLANLEQQKVEGEQNFQTYKTQATQDTEENIDEQRRIASELQQGIQSRYGGTTGTGAFVADLVGRETSQSIGKFRQNLQGEYFKVLNMQNNLLKTYHNEKQKISDQSAQLIREAKDTLDQRLAELQTKKGEVNIQKHNQKRESFSQYQSLVQDINKRNTEKLFELEKQKNEIQNKLSSNTYKMTYNALQNSLDRLDALARAGALTPKGLEQAEAQLGFPPGSLQFPVAKVKEDEKKKRLQDIADIAGYTPALEE